MTSVAEAIVHFSTTGAYPEDETTIASELSTDVLTDVLGSLRKARDEVRKEVHALSKTTGSNVEQWITLAKELQNDIQRSRDVARSIVEENEVVNKLKEQSQDDQSKIALLEKEIQYEATLEDTLHKIGHANTALLQTQDAVVKGDVTEALKLLRTARDAVTALSDVASTKAVSILDARGRNLKSSIEDTIVEAWSSLLHVNAKQGRFEVNNQVDGKPYALQGIAKAAEDTGILQRLVDKLIKDIDRAITQRALSTFGTGKQVNLTVQCPAIKFAFVSDDGNGNDLVSFFSSLLDFFASQLPDPVRSLLVPKYIPVLIGHLEERWLGPSIPTEVSHISAFSSTMDQVDRLAAQLDALSFPGTTQLREWTDNVPKSWLTKRRETLLGNARDIVFEKLHQTNTVQRVETQVISTNSEPVQTSQDEEWGDAWDEEEEAAPAQNTTAKPAEPAVDDDDGSAWDLDDTEVTAEDAQADEEAWGWGDDANQGAGPPSPSQTKSSSHRPVEKQETQTLSETYTVTAVPDELFDMIEAVVADAQTLAGPQYADSPLAQAAAGLYSLPTLALAIYRATAVTAYSSLPAGNMMIYSDATRLSERLRAWQASQPPASRLRLDNDAKALDEFARRAYSSEMEAQRTIMRDLLDGAQGFTSCTVPPFKSACESAVEQAVDRVREVHKSWQGLLAPSALPQAVGSLLATLTGKMIADVEDLSDISEPESQQLKSLCDRVTSLKDLFTKDNGAEGPSDLTFVYCPNWLKFQYLAEILESSLADIRYLWNEGELSLEFEPDAVVDLIKALFAESDKRRQAISEVKRGGRR